MPNILLLRPQPYFALVTAQLKRVASLGRYMTVQGTVRSEWMADDGSDDVLRTMATLCEELQPDSLYARYANNKVYRRAKDFWATTDAQLKSYVKRMADQRIERLLRLAADHDIPVLYVSDDHAALHIDDRLRFRLSVQATPLMHFSRHDGGTTYRLQLRLDGQTADHLSRRGLHVLTFEPGLFTLDGTVCSLASDFSAQLLQPFTAKDEVEIPQHMEATYFRRFIFKHVARAEVQADGFDIADSDTKPQARLVVETAIDGRQQLTLRFDYGPDSYTLGNTAPGRVRLCEEADGTPRFTRQLRRRDEEQRLADALRDVAGTLMTQRGTLRFDTTEQLVGWLRQNADRLRQQDIDVVQPQDPPYYIGPLSVEQSDTWQGDWLQTDVTVVVDEGRLRLPFSELRAAILRGEQQYLLPTGQLLVVPTEWLSRYTPLLLTGQKSGKGFRRHRLQVAAEAAPPTPSSLCPAVLPPGPPPPVPQKLRATLRPYQLAGYHWLWHNLTTHTGCCLSDEMGLGKTLQTIALLLRYKETAHRTTAPAASAAPLLFTDEEMRGETVATPDNDGDTAAIDYRCSLVVAPASVVHNWANELQRFAPSLLVQTYTGDTAKRRMKREALTRWDVVLTTYRTLLNDAEQLGAMQFGIVVFDESQAFKNHTSQLYHAVAALQAQQRVALSGTPVENGLDELWSLMSVLNPPLLGSLQSYHQRFALPIARGLEQERQQLLRQMVAPYFLKRTKDEVLGDLPERQDEVVRCPMTTAQASAYAEELSRARNEWLDPQAAEGERNVHMMQAIQRLRQIANGEGKLNVVFDHLESLRGTGHKVLLFSEYVTLLEQVADEMERRGWRYEMLTGHTTLREQVIARFQSDADRQFFLISLKAGGVGLNLTAADYVMLLDPWWNLAAEEQAIARAHRIGQRRAVFVYRYVSEGTLEEQILTLQQRKQTLIDSVMPFICG